MAASLIENLTKKVKELPQGIRQFAIKATLLFVGWKLLYYFLLMPMNQPDRWLTQQTAKATAQVLSVLRNDGHYEVVDVFDKQVGIDYGNALVFKSIVVKDHKKILGIANACNALELFVLYGLFLFCMPASLKRLLSFLCIGLAAIFVLNVTRCALIGNINLNGHRQLADMAHHYIFKLLMYLLIFGAWVWYCNKLSFEKV